MKNYLFPNSLKKWSTSVFYLSIIIGGYLFLSDKIDNTLVVKVFNLFPDNMIIKTPQTENIIGTNSHWIENGILDEILSVLIILSGIISSFSKEKIEDELISKIRMESLTSSLYINYGLIIISTILIYDIVYFDVMVFNLFTILLFFNLILNFKLYKHYKS